MAVPWLAALAMTGLAACGSAPATELPPAAEPAASPALTVRPAGRVVPIGNQPEGVAVDHVTGLVAVALRRPDVLALADARSGAVRSRVRLPAAARHLSMAAPGGPVLVPAENADGLVRVSLPGGRAQSATVGRQPHDAAAAGGRTFVADELGADLTVLEGARVAGRPRTALQPGGVASLDVGRKVAVVAVRERVLELVDTDTLRRVARAPAGTGPTHVVSDGGHHVYVVDTKGGALLVYRTRPDLQLTRRYPLPGSPYGIAFDPERGRIWVTLTATNELVELAAGARPHRLRTFATVRQPDTVAVDPVSGRVFVTGRVQGVLQLLDPPPLPRSR